MLFSFFEVTLLIGDCPQLTDGGYAAGTMTGSEPFMSHEASG